MRRTAVIAAASILAATVGLAPHAQAGRHDQATTAYAATTLVGVKKLVINGQHVGSLNVYWDGVRNSARMVHQGAWYGVATYTAVGIDRIPDPDGRADTWEGNDIGTYRYYAGPVYTGDARGRCVDVYGSMTVGGVNSVVGFYNAFCG